MRYVAKLVDHDNEIRYVEMMRPATVICIPRSIQSPLLVDDYVPTDWQLTIGDETIIWYELDETKELWR